jgi:hypothetical protein
MDNDPKGDTMYSTNPSTQTAFLVMDVQTSIVERYAHNICGLRGPEKGEGKAEKAKIGSSNEAFLVDNSIDGM